MMKMEEWLVVLLLVCSCSIGTLSGAESDMNYAFNGKVCRKCPPGTHVDQHCTADFTNSTCVPCPDHQFMDVWNGMTHCKACVIANCPPNGQEVRACTPTTDRLCLCQPGFHRYPLDVIDVQFECKAHSTCGPNQGVVSYGNHSHDTQCGDCLEGQQFVNRTDPERPRCEPCSLCPPGSPMLANCTLTHDTFCSLNATEDGTTDPSNTDGSGGLEGGEVAGVVVGCILLVAAICFLGFILYRKRRDLCLAGSQKEPESMGMIQQWTESMIENRVFPFLSQELGSDWRPFIHRLPGWPETFSVAAMIENKIEEEPMVPNRVMGCLNMWKRKVVDPRYFCKDKILEALKTTNKDLVGRLEKHMEPAGPATENGQQQV